jgi:hypothetical protein
MTSLKGLPDPNDAGEAKKDFPWRYSSELMKIMEAAWTGDTTKAAAYAVLMASKLEDDGQPEQARYLRRRVEELQGKREALRVNPAAQRAQPPTEAATAVRKEPPLFGHWHHGQGYLVSGTIRISRWDCDTNPPVEFRNGLLDWMCEVLNAAVNEYQQRRD